MGGRDTVCSTAAATAGAAVAAAATAGAAAAAAAAAARSWCYIALRQTSAKHSIHPPLNIQTSPEIHA